MTQEQKKQIIKGAYYMTQYASYSSDEGVYETLISRLEANNTDFNLVFEFLKLTKNATDFINQKVYNSIFYHLTDDNLEKLIRLYKAIEDEDIIELENLFNLRYGIYELYDGLIGDYNFFESIADEDLKTNGISARALEWAHKIPYGDDGIFELDIYDDFNEITFDDILERLFERYDLDDII